MLKVKHQRSSVKGQEKVPITRVLIQNQSNKYLWYVTKQTQNYNNNNNNDTSLGIKAVSYGIEKNNLKFFTKK